MALWHPDARRVTYSDLGAFTMDVEPRIVWHTIEGNHLPQYNSSHPHLTYDPRNDDLWQHSPINHGVKTLKHPAGTVETNRARAIQVELFGFARETQSWPDRWYDNVADLARWIERNAGVARVCDVEFAPNGQYNRMSAGQWLRAKGHLGHQHVPVNDHWDPGDFRIGKVLDLNADVRRAFDGGEQGMDVAAFQRAVNRIARYCCRPDRKVDVDGVVGPQTMLNGAWACYMHGLGQSQEQFRERIGMYAQEKVREGVDSLTATEVARRRERRAAHCRCD